MNRHASAYTIVKELDLTEHGITSPDTQVFRSLGAESPEVRPFVVMMWGSTDTVVKSLAEERLQVWVYDESSYVPIDAILEKIRDAFLAAPALLGDIVWNGYSADMYDDIFKCPTRYAAFTLPAGTN